LAERLRACRRDHHVPSWRRHVALESRCCTSGADASPCCQLEAPAPAGEIKWPRCTLAYAPPEVVAAVDASRHVEVSAAHDMWALGVMAFEAIAGRVAFTMVSDIRECASGRAPYPWELPADEQPPAWRRSRLRGLLSPCLAREPAGRPSAATLLESVARMGDATTLKAEADTAV
jgi:serine/threonine protein kinase